MKEVFLVEVLIRIRKFQNKNIEEIKNSTARCILKKMSFNSFAIENIGLYKQEAILALGQLGD